VCRQRIALACATLRLAMLWRRSLVLSSYACCPLAARLQLQCAGSRSLSSCFGLMLAASRPRCLRPPCVAAGHSRMCHACSHGVQAGDRFRVLDATPCCCGFARSCFGLMLVAGQKHAYRRSLQAADRSHTLTCAWRYASPPWLTHSCLGPVLAASQQHACSLSLQAADRSRVCGAAARRCGFARSCYGLVLAAGQQRSCSRSLPLSCAGR